jgi:hypothetical protein
MLGEMKSMRQGLIAFAMVAMAAGGRIARADGAPSNQTLNVQGILRTQAGDLQSTAVGLVVSLYSSQAAPSAFFSQSFTTVPIENGFFSVELSGMSLSFDAADAWVGIQVAGDATEMPRQHLTAVPYAWSAGSVSGVVSAAHGGTGLTSGPTAAGQYLRSSAAGAWSVGTIQASDIGSGIDVSQLKQPAGGKGNSGNDVALSSTGKTIASVTINAPGAGVAFVSATGAFWIWAHTGGGGGSGDDVNCTLSSTPTTTESPARLAIPQEFGSWGGTGEAMQVPFGTTMIATLPAAGSYTFSLVCSVLFGCNTPVTVSSTVLGTCVVDNPKVQAVYLPKAY